MIDIDIDKSELEGYYCVSVYVDRTTVEYGNVSKEDLTEILVDLRTTIDSLMEEIA